MTDLWALLAILLAVAPAIAILWHRGHTQTPGRHRADGDHTDVVYAGDLIPGQDAAAQAAQQRMASAVARETGR